MFNFENPLYPAREILRCAQNDTAALRMTLLRSE